MSESSALIVALAMFAAVVALAVIFGWALVKARGIVTERQMELAKWATANNLTFNPARDPSLGPRFYHVVPIGFYGAGWNVMEGICGGRAICAFDFSHGDNDCSSAVVVDAGLPLKRLHIRPMAEFDAMVQRMGYLESIEFNDKFGVKAADRRWAYDVLSQKTMELMLHNDCPFIDFHGTQAAAFGGTKQYFRPRDFSCALEVLTGMLDNLPPAVVEELKAKRS